MNHSKNIFLLISAILIIIIIGATSSKFNNYCNSDEHRYLKFSEYVKLDFTKIFNVKKTADINDQNSNNSDHEIYVQGPGKVGLVLLAYATQNLFEIINLNNLLNSYSILFINIVSNILLFIVIYLYFNKYRLISFKRSLYASIILCTSPLAMIGIMGFRSYGPITILLITLIFICLKIKKSNFTIAFLFSVLMLFNPGALLIIFLIIIYKIIVEYNYEKNILNILLINIKLSNCFLILLIVIESIYYINNSSFFGYVFDHISENINQNQNQEVIHSVPMLSFFYSVCVGAPIYLYLYIQKQLTEKIYQVFLIGIAFDIILSLIGVLPLGRVMIINSYLIIIPLYLNSNFSGNNKLNISIILFNLALLSKYYYRFICNFENDYYLYEIVKYFG